MSELAPYQKNDRALLVAACLAASEDFLIDGGVSELQPSQQIRLPG